MFMNSSQKLARSVDFNICIQFCMIFIFTLIYYMFYYLKLWSYVSIGTFCHPSVYTVYVYCIRIFLFYDTKHNMWLIVITRHFWLNACRCPTCDYIHLIQFSEIITGVDESVLCQRPCQCFIDNLRLLQFQVI
jgi:hypothetical protein